MGNRFYNKDQIIIRKPSLDKLKEWNATKPEIGFDYRFINLLLLDCFGVKMLKKSSVLGGKPHNSSAEANAPLNPDRVDFIRGTKNTLLLIIKKFAD